MAMRKITRSDRLRYWFDNTMSRGPIALIGWLFLLSAALVVVASLIIFVTRIDPEVDGQHLGFGGLMWMSLMHALDAGNLAGDQGSPAFILSTFMVTLGGIFVVSTFIGVLTSGIESKLESLRKGRSFVVESGHTVILGWSSQVFSIISELVIANANQRNPRIVVLAEMDKVEMEEEIRSNVGDTGRTRIVCRTGSPVDMGDLEIVNLHEARSIIILAPESGNPDSQVIKAILAITNNPKRRATPYHIVTEIRDPKNLEVARMVGRDEAELVLVGDLIARMMVQTCQQSGLSVVYTELLDFSGDEIYVQEEPQLVGKTFGAALFSYAQSAVLGLRTSDGRTLLNPPGDTLIGAGDKIIAVTEDDDTLKLSGLTEFQIDATAISTTTPQPSTTRHTLLLGWNQRALTIINELDHYVAPGSEVLVVTDVLEDPAAVAAECTTRNQTVRFVNGDITDRRLLDQLDLRTYDHVLVLSHSEVLDEQEADARTLITLLHLRDMSERSGHDLSIVSEMLDIRNRELAEVTHADDFIVSDKLVGLMLSQVSENKQLAAVFADLFNAEGSEIYLKPARDYVELGRPVNFYTVLEAAQRRGEVAFGYRLSAAASDATQAYGVKLNPLKSQMLSFAEDDRIVVLAES